MNKVLITGATGFIGRHCLQPLLAHGFEVHAVATRTPHVHTPDIYWHRADLLHPEQALALIAAVQPTHLLHFAWYVVPGSYWTSVENVRWVEASLGLLRAFASHGGQRVVVAGTCAEYDWTAGICQENVTPLAPATLYGSCKHALQVLLQASAEQMGLQAAWGRIFSLYGPHEHPKRLVASVIRSLLHNQPALCSHGDQIRDMLYVCDVADAFVALLQSTVVGPVNIASGQPVVLKDLIYAIAEKLQKTHLVQLGALPTALNEPHLLLADVRRLREEVGWAPQHDLNAGLDHTIDWWKQHLMERSSQH